MFWKLWNKLFGPFWDEMFVFEVKLFWCFQDRLFPLSFCNGYLNSTSLSLVSGIYWKVAVSCPDIAVKQKCLKCRLVAVKAKRGSHFRKGEQDLWRDPCQDQTGRRSSWGHASADGHRMVIPPYGRPVASCCLLQASSLDCFAPGQVVFSVPLCFIGTTPAMWVKLPQFYGLVLVSRGWSACSLCISSSNHFSWMFSAAGFVPPSLSFSHREVAKRSKTYI